MPPQFDINGLRNKLDSIELLLKTHKHASFDLTTPLTNLDFNLIARTSLGAAASSIVLDGISPRRFLRILIEHDAKSGNGNSLLRFNNDAAGNYTFIENGNNTARTSQTSVDLLDGANNSLGYFYIIDVINIFNLVKAVRADAVARIGAASTAQTRHRITGTWVNTTALITRVDLVASANNLPSGTTLSIYGSRD